MAVYYCMYNGSILLTWRRFSAILLRVLGLLLTVCLMSIHVFYHTFCYCFSIIQTVHVHEDNWQRVIEISVKTHFGCFFSVIQTHNTMRSIVNSELRKVSLIF